MSHAVAAAVTVVTDRCCYNILPHGTCIRGSLGRKASSSSTIEPHESKNQDPFHLVCDFTMIPFPGSCIRITKYCPDMLTTCSCPRYHQTKAYIPDLLGIAGQRPQGSVLPPGFRRPINCRLYGLYTGIWALLWLDVCKGDLMASALFPTVAFV